MPQTGASSFSGDRQEGARHDPVSDLIGEPGEESRFGSRGGEAAEAGSRERGPSGGAANGKKRRVRRRVKGAAADKQSYPNKKQKPANDSRQVDGQSPSRHRRAPAAGTAPGPAYAALDLGTNNCRLLVAVPRRHGHFRVVDSFSRIVRLGEGIGSSGRLGEAAMDRALAALKICAAKLGSRRIHRYRLIATEACRKAANGAQFLERVKRDTGMNLEIVDRETEARLAAEGCGTLVDRKCDAAMLFDIGGGSTELILIDRRDPARRRLSDQVRAWTSLPVGVITLAERHGGRVVTRPLFETMVEEVRQQLRQFADESPLGEVWGSGRVHLLGTSGTVTTLAGVHLELPRYDRRKVDGIWLAANQIDRVTDQLLAMKFEERARNPCIGSDRADLVLAGCAILQAIRDNWPSPWLRVADRGLREGLLMQMMHEDRVWRSPRRGRKSRRAGGRRAARDNDRAAAGETTH